MLGMLLYPCTHKPGPLLIIQAEDAKRQKPGHWVCTGKRQEEEKGRSLALMCGWGTCFLTGTKRPAWNGGPENTVTVTSQDPCVKLLCINNLKRTFIKKDKPKQARNAVVADGQCF